MRIETGRCTRNGRFFCFSIRNFWKGPSMIRSSVSLVAVILTLSGCNALRSDANTTEVVLGDCRNGAIMTQATFGGPLRCGPQTEPVFTEVTAAPES